MGDKSKIEWTEATWNPVTGCTKVSQGCKHCYAERIAERMWDKQYPPNADGTPRRFTDIRLHLERLDQPLRWKKPRMIFVNSMSDLFHERVPDDFIQRIFGVMVGARQHTYQVLTKRAERMYDFLNRWSAMALALPQFRHIWLGVSVEDQKAADERIPLLLQTPAAVRFLSCEPLLGPVDLRPGFWIPYRLLRTHERKGQAIDWVIVGGESGPGARPMHPDWARSIRDQCQAAGVPFFFKQGSQANWPSFKDFQSFPVDLQVRTFPNAA